MAERQDAIDLIFGEFRTYWEANATGAPPIAWQGLPYDSPDNLTAWVRVSVVHGDSDLISIGEVGTRAWRTFGMVFVQVFTSLNQNRKVADDLVETAIKAFRGKSVGSSPRVRFRGISTRELGADGPWNHTNVTIKFEYDATA